MIPIVFPHAWSTMIRLSSESSASGRPKRTRRSITGITVLRRLINPLRKSGVSGIRVISVIRMISRTLVISMPYNSLARLKLTNCIVPWTSENVFSTPRDSSVAVAIVCLLELDVGVSWKKGAAACGCRPANQQATVVDLSRGYLRAVARGPHAELAHQFAERRGLGAEFLAAGGHFLAAGRRLLRHLGERLGWPSRLPRRWRPVARWPRQSR